MAWTAKVVDKDDAQRVVNLVFTEGVTGEVYANRYSIPMNASTTWLEDLVRDQITALQARAATGTAISLGTIAPSAAVAATVVDTARDKWVADFLKLKRMNVLVAQGVLTSLDIAAQLALVKAGYQASYIDSVNNQT